MRTRVDQYLAVIIVSVALVILTVVPVRAATVNWTDTTGFWDVAGNWSSNPLLPGAGDDVSITISGGPWTITHRTGTDTIHSLANSNIVVVNGGSILNISTGGTNTGTLQAGGSSAGALNLNGGTLTNTGGVLSADVDGRIVLNSVALVGGNLNSTGSGTFAATNNGNNFLSGATLNGLIDLATNTGIERVVNGLTMVSGSNININSNSILTFQGDQTLGGTGTITLGSTGSSNRIGIDGTSTLTVGPNVLIHGQNGTIGQVVFAGGTTTLANGGTVSADVAGGTINLSAGQTNNTGALTAANGGTLQLNGPVTNTGSGHIDAGDGSAVVQNGVTVTGGTINTTGTGAFVPLNNSGNFLSGATLNGLIDLATNTGIERVVNGLTMVSGSNININSNSILTFQGDQTLGGTGTITLGSTGSSNRIGIDGTSTLTVGPNVLIHGQNGTIGQVVFAGGTTSLVNNGTIAADVASGIIAISPSGTFTNNGLLNAQNGTINVTRPVQGNGTLQVGANGAMNLQGSGTSTTGNLFHNGNAASSLNIGPNNVTVSIDYNNANFGVGDAFNRRANVSGTGQILAAGGVAQAVTGANVTGGTTATPTLTIGNVHVGANTFNYQIANNGTTGPSLRGAIQTGVNGGNITDSRLSGTGVTASNWGPVPTSGKSGDLAVTFTVASPGLLSPLTGQAVHIANNFDNVAPQTMSIVLGSNAAAYNLAQSSTIGTINLGVLHVGDNGGSVSQALSVTNIAPTSSFSEGLDSNFGSYANNGGTLIPTFTGSITNLAAGSTDNSSMHVTLSTATAGTVNGNITIHQASNGTISGLPNTPLSDQTPAVTGSVSATITNLAVPQINNAPISFGNVRIGTSPTSQAVSVTNAAPVSQFSEGLIASVAGTSNNQVSAAGGFGSPGASLAAGSTNNTGILVNIDTSSAGAKSGNAIVNFKSDGTAFPGGTVTDLGNTNVAVSGNVYRLANPTVNTGSITLAARMGDTSPSAGISVTNSSPDIYTEGLNVTRGATAVGFTSSGGISNLIAGGTNASAIQVALNTGTAGTFTGTQALNFVSTGTGTTGASDVSVGSGSVNLTGKAYTPAVATVGTTSINFGIVHVGDGGGSLSRAVTVTNGATATALNDVLIGSISASPSPFSGSGNLGAGLVAGQTNNTSLNVALNTNTAGVFSSAAYQANLTLSSHNPDMTDLALTTSPIGLSAQVNNYALSDFVFGSGAGIFSQSGSTFYLNYGTLFQGTGTFLTTLFAENAAAGPADLLDGTFSFLDTPDFGESGFNSFTDFAAGDKTGPLMLSFDTSAVGTFSDTIILHGIGHNGSGYSAAIDDIMLVVQGGVIQGGGEQVPEPSTWLLMFSGLGSLAAARRYLSTKKK